MTDIFLEVKRGLFAWPSMLAGMLIGGVIIGFISFYEASKPRLYMKDSGGPVLVHGLDVISWADQYRTRSPCEGATTIRRMVRYWDEPKNTKIMEVKAIREQVIMDEDTGDQHFRPHFTLYTPLPADGPAPWNHPWHMTTEVHESCGISDIILGTPVEVKRNSVQYCPNGMVADEAGNYRCADTPQPEVKNLAE